METEDNRIPTSLVEQIIDTWGGASEKAARNMIEQYGLPHEATAGRLIWFENKPWKHTIVTRDEVPHNFPAPHADVLEQAIDYQVPLEKLAEIAAFDGSLIIDRTKGEVSARCDSEGKNILALNLMHEIVIGKRTAEDARNFLAETAAAFLLNKPSQYTGGLMFDIPEKTPDPDKSVLGPMIGGAFNAAVDALRGADEPGG